MKKILLFIFFFPVIILAQKTYIPDDAFEQVLINLEVDDFFDDSVYTSAIDTLTVLYINNSGITDLKGIEDFVSLTDLFCYNNNLTSLDLRFNPNLIELNCNNNQLTSLDVRNGNNSALWYFTAINNPNLYCIAVDDIFTPAQNYWLKDSFCTFSDNCGYLSLVNDLNTNRNIIKVIDIFGRKINDKKSNTTLIYIYEDGSAESRFIVNIP